VFKIDESSCEDRTKYNRKFAHHWRLPNEQFADSGTISSATSSIMIKESGQAELSGAAGLFALRRLPNNVVYQLRAATLHREAAVR